MATRYAVGYAEYPHFSGAYFDGDVDKYLSQEQPEIAVYLSGDGYSEKHDETPQILKELVTNIIDSAPADVTFRAYISNPETAFSEMKHKVNFQNVRYPPVKYEDYMKLISYAYAVKENGKTDINICQTQFYDIDEYTAISDDNIDTHILSEQDFTFRPVIYEDTKVYRGIYKYDYRAEENILSIRKEGISVSLQERLHHFILRLDREHYQIKENTIALRIGQFTDGSSWDGKALYVSFGYAPYDSDNNHWYYMDDDYLYLYVYFIAPEIYNFENEHNVCIAFADIEDYSVR